jgi:hypothetical protein
MGLLVNTLKNDSYIFNLHDRYQLSTKAKISI